MEREAEKMGGWLGLLEILLKVSPGLELPGVMSLVVVGGGLRAPTLWIEKGERGPGLLLPKGRQGNKSLRRGLATR